MRKLSVLLIGAVLAACHDGAAPPGLGPDPSEVELSRSGSSTGPFVAGQVIARFTPGAAGQAIAAAHGARVREGLRVPGVWLLDVPAGRELATATALARNPNVVFAEPDWLLATTPCGPDNCLALNDPFFGRKWDLNNDGNIYNTDGSVLARTGTAGADIDWLQAYTLLGRDFDGSATIGILDTGIRGTHEDLAGKVVANRNFYGIGAVNPNQWSDSDGHGTHVAGIAAAHANNARGIAGVGYGANIRLINARVCGQAGCPTSSIADAIVWAVDQGANVLNLSLGGPSPQAAIKTALANAESRGVLAFCASGNNGSGSVSFPAAFPECVAVGSTTWSDTRASYSNWGPEVELSAPGGDDNPAGTAFSYIASAYNSSNTSYVYMAGTSMATPQAAGLAALVYAAGLTDRAALRQHLQNTSDDLGPAGRDDAFGYGRINAFRAVANVVGNGGGGGGWWRRRSAGGSAGGAARSVLRLFVREQQQLRVHGHEHGQPDGLELELRKHRKEPGAHVHLRWQPYGAAHGEQGRNPFEQHESGHQLQFTSEVRAALQVKQRRWGVAGHGHLEDVNSGGVSERPALELP